MALRSVRTPPSLSLMPGSMPPQDFGRASTYITSAFSSLGHGTRQLQLPQCMPHDFSLCMRQWGCFSRSHVSRLYIAKQVMASMVYYHAQFIQPAPAQLQEMVSLIARFVARPALGGGGGDEVPQAFMQHPELAAASMR